MHAMQQRMHAIFFPHDAYDEQKEITLTRGAAKF